jgi:hypothetical protein
MEYFIEDANSNNVHNYALKIIYFYAIIKTKIKIKKLCALKKI